MAVNTITLNLAPVVSITSGEGNAVNIGPEPLTLNAIATRGIGNPANYIYQWYYANASNVIIPGARSSTYNVFPWYPGSYNYIVTANDSVGYVARSPVFTLSINNGIAVGLAPSRDVIHAGQNVTFMPNSATTPYSISYLVFQNQQQAVAGSNYAIAAGNSNEIQFFSRGSYQVFAQAVTANGMVGYSKPISITVNAAPTVQDSDEFSFFNQWWADVGVTATPSIQIFGGTGSYNVTWYLNGNQIGEFNGINLSAMSTINVIATNA